MRRCFRRRRWTLLSRRNWEPSSMVKRSNTLPQCPLSTIPLSSPRRLASPVKPARDFQFFLSFLLSTKKNEHLISVTFDPDLT
jgi:hypothetical protein